jgi:uncharacterized protein (TIGR01732 family)
MLYSAYLFLGILNILGALRSVFLSRIIFLNYIGGNSIPIGTYYTYIYSKYKRRGIMFGYSGYGGYYGGYGYGYGGFGYRRVFALVVVLFILLIIIGASFC